MSISNVYLNEKVAYFLKNRYYFFNWTVILKTAVGKMHFDGEPQVLDFHHR